MYSYLGVVLYVKRTRRRNRQHVLNGVHGRVGGGRALLPVRQGRTHARRRAPGSAPSCSIASRTCRSGIRTRVRTYVRVQVRTVVLRTCTKLARESKRAGRSTDVVLAPRDLLSLPARTCRVRESRTPKALPPCRAPAPARTRSGGTVWRRAMRASLLHGCTLHLPAAAFDTTNVRCRVQARYDYISKQKIIVREKQAAAHENCSALNVQFCGQLILTY